MGRSPGTVLKFIRPYFFYTGLSYSKPLLLVYFHFKYQKILIVKKVN